MGVKKEEIVYIDKDAMATYDGEPVILPISMPLVDYREKGIAGRFSKKIAPIFLGLTLVKENLMPEEVEYLKKHEPIGCRDERTYNTMCKYGIDAYLGGCITALLPKRTGCGDNGKIFVIDPPNGLLKHIPNELREKCVFDTHLIYGDIDDPRKMAIERYSRYASEASMVITSLLHCSVPCMAMGIPVILAKDLVSYRFGWLEALLHIYTQNEYERINWSPAPVEYEMHKKRNVEFVAKRLNGIIDTDKMNGVHEFYMNRGRNEYCVDVFVSLKRFIDSTWLDKSAAYKYAVWGVTQISELAVDYIETMYPNARLCHVYDAGYPWVFKGITAKHPDNIKYYPDETVLVTVASAGKAAKKYFQEIGRTDDTYGLVELI